MIEHLDIIVCGGSIIGGLAAGIYIRSWMIADNLHDYHSIMEERYIAEEAQRIELRGYTGNRPRY